MKALLLLLLLAFAAVKGQSDRPNAALVVGGYWRGHPDGAVRNTVELFGCHGPNGRVTVQVKDFPEGVYLAGGTYWEDEGLAMICGGYECIDQTNCGIRDVCRTWDLKESSSWTDHSNLGNGRWSFIMTDAKDEGASNQMTKLVAGFAQTTEIYRNNMWVEYKDLPERSWYALGCLTAFKDKMYNIRSGVVELDMDDWIYRELSETPSAFTAPGRCSYVNIDGQDGIMLRYGYFYNLTSKAFVKMAAPPYNPIHLVPNALFRFRDRPTIFGNPWCDNEGQCTNTEVIQYNPEINDWVSLGHMTEPRTYHEVIEVPGEFCDNYMEYVPPDNSAVNLSGAVTVVMTTFLARLL